MATPDFSKTRGDDWTINVTMGDITGQTKVYFTIKTGYGKLDSQSIIQVDSVNGLLYSDAQPGTAANASLTVDNESTGACTITVSAEETAKAPTSSVLVYDASWVDASGNVATPVSGHFEVSGDVTRATS